MIKDSTTENQCRAALAKPAPFWSGIIETVNDRRLRDLEVIGQRIHDEIVKPLCLKYGLAYRTINGHWWFTILDPTPEQKEPTPARRHRGWMIIDDPETASEYGLSILAPVMDTLSLECDRHSDIGHYVPCFGGDQ